MDKEKIYCTVNQTMTDLELPEGTELTKHGQTIKLERPCAGCPKWGPGKREDMEDYLQDESQGTRRTPQKITNILYVTVGDRNQDREVTTEPVFEVDICTHLPL